MKPCAGSIKRTLNLVEEMLNLADQGDAVGGDTGCGVLCRWCEIRPLRSKKLVEEEKAAPIKKGWWKE